MTHGFFDEMTELFQLLGMTEEGARQATIGRYRSERDAREGMDGVTVDSSPDAAALAEHLIPGSTLPVVEQAEIRLSSAAQTYLGMGQAESGQYAARHRERAESRSGDQVASARYLLGLAEALAAVPVAPTTVRPAVAPAPRPGANPAVTAESLTRAVNRATAEAGRRVAEIVARSTTPAHRTFR